MEDCLFCKIIAGEVPSAKVYEDDKFVAFLDINPVTPGHTLVVPKKHSYNVLDTDEDVLCELGRILKKISKAVCDGMDTESFNLNQNNGEVSGQVIPHLHWHIVPRYEDDGLRLWPGKPYEDGEAEKVAEKIKSLSKY
jgi:histidine triad (HIT) family protein